MRYFGVLLMLAVASLASAGDAKAPVAADSMPAVVEDHSVAYDNGAFTPDGRHFVYAVLPKVGTDTSAIRAIDVATGKISSLGLVPLRQKPPAGERLHFVWSLGVYAVSNDLSVVFLSQYGSAEDMTAVNAFAWDLKQKSVVKATDQPNLEQVLKERRAPAKLKVQFEELDAAAVQARKNYQKLADAPKVVGKKQVTVGAGIPMDVTPQFTEMYTRAVKEFDKYSLGGERHMLIEDTFLPLAQRGDWTFALAGTYVHYGIQGRGYQRVLLLNGKTGKVHAFPQIGGESASGMRSSPLETILLAAPDGGAVVAIWEGKLALYRAPAP